MTQDTASQAEARSFSIRPFTDVLRKAHPGTWRRHYDTVAGGRREVSLVALFRGTSPVVPIAVGTPVSRGDRMLDVQMSDDGNHRVSHMVVTQDGVLAANPSNPRADPSPTRLRGTTYPTYFATPEEMVAAIGTELSRKDHKL